MAVNIHASLIRDLNSGRLLLAAVDGFDKTCLPRFDERWKGWFCECSACSLQRKEFQRLESQPEASH